MTSLTTLAVDAMGGDFGPSVTVPAVLEILATDKLIRVLLVGQPEQLLEQLRLHGITHHPQLEIIPAAEVVAMDEKPGPALKNKKNSSMRIAINLVHEGRADCCVSAGNTGALMAIARFVLKMLPGIDRPAIATALPSHTGRVYVLDLGANVDCAPEHLQQFAIMGSILCSAVEHKQNPTVGLLNIGHEAIKGSDIIKKAGELLRQAPINFYGNVEGDDLFRGTVDVVVCDGFVGNAVLKSSEGLAWMLGQMVKTEFSRGIGSRLAAVIALPVLKRLKKRVDHRGYNGASLLGLRGLVIKSHGGADVYAFRHALSYAISEVQAQVLNQIKQTMAEMDSQNEIH